MRRLQKMKKDSRKSVIHVEKHVCLENDAEKLKIEGAVPDGLLKLRPD
jgi:hypothetical protein